MEVGHYQVRYFLLDTWKGYNYSCPAVFQVYKNVYMRTDFPINMNYFIQTSLGAHWCPGLAALPFLVSFISALACPFCKYSLNGC